MRRAARVVPLLAVLAIAAVGPMPGGAGTAQTGVPQVSLTAPANGALVQGNAVTFAWRVDWSQPPPTGTVIVVHRLATDPGFTQMVSTNTQACPVTNVNCWTSYKPNASYKGRYYWQVTLTGAAEATSDTWMFTAVEPQPEVDRTRPYVLTLNGSARRGKRAFFSAKVRDNSGEVRMRALLTYRGLPVLEGRTPFAPVYWRAPQRFHSTRPLSRRLPAGIYKICITAWDKAGNQGRSCARYRVR
jgi:hypothetical protein